MNEKLITNVSKINVSVAFIFAGLSTISHGFNLIQFFSDIFVTFIILSIVGTLPIIIFDLLVRRFKKNDKKDI